VRPTGTAIAGLGATPYWHRGGSTPRTSIELAGTAILAAVEDAGCRVEDIDGFAYFAGGLDTALLVQTLGVPEVRFTATVTGSGGGSAAALGLAAAAVSSGLARTVVSVVSMRQAGSQRMGRYYAKDSAYSGHRAAEQDFYLPSGLSSPGQMFALLAARHMHEYGTTRQAFAEVAISSRRNASTRPTALRREPLTEDEYFSAKMLSDPLCRYDFCLESDGAIAVITTSIEHARDLRQTPIQIVASAQGGSGRWGKAIEWMGMPEDIFASSGHRSVARTLYQRAGIAATDIDVALLFDHFTPMVIMQLEDYGFCEIGQGGDFVLAGHARWPDGSIPVNTHGGNLSEAYLLGMTHIREAVEQLRGTAVNQVEDAELALVTGGPAYIPVSSVVLAR
jgi:acetyl-CoA acetyltransferase